jgi:hypothetical protein
MPVVPNRAAEDQALTAAMLLVFGQYRTQAEAWLAGHLSIPDEFYGRLRTAIEATALAHLERVSSDSANRLASSLGIPASEAAQQDSRLWAQQRASQLASEFVDRTQQWVAEIVAKAQAAADSRALAAAVAAAGMATVFSTGRAKSLGITETTGAASAGEMNAAQRIEQDYGVEVVAYWTVDETSNVCPICNGLHGKPQDDWEQVYPGGPPGHPGCACSLRFEVSGDLPKFSEN